MKTLEKGLLILETISYRNQIPTTPSEISDLLDINVSTCTRLMQTLARRGYLVRVSKQAGYILGPTLVVNNSCANIYKDMTNAATEPLKKFSKKIQAMVNFSVITNDLRYILFNYGHTSDIKIISLFGLPWNYKENATERLLLSAQSKSEQKRIIETYGIPDNFNSVADFDVYLEQINMNGTVKFYSKNQKLWIGGLLFRLKRYPVAAIGYGVKTEEDVDKSLLLAIQTEKEIRENLTTNHMILI